TADFNRNVLRRLNSELDADFDLDHWLHYAPYVPARGRIEMHLVSDRNQEVHVGDETFHFYRGDSIRTELSHKYTRPGFDSLAEAAGFEVMRHWMDDEQLFCVSLLRVSA
ncbi:MAG: L-histidine N(alpha)-methyltransferase, partial [Planctomycetota bacterium]